jgi:hypothetical protein
MKRRKSWSRKWGRPAARLAAMNRLVSQFGSHGLALSDKS